jgi:hypothetical protein
MSNRRAALALRRDDFYATPRVAVTALLAIEPDMPRVIWEPACGDGAIVGPLRAAGHIVIATDLVDRGCPEGESGIDFVLFKPYRLCEGIITNPPFKLADEFVRRALALAPYVAMLLRINFLASTGRKGLFSSHPPARIHVSSRRFPMMHRQGWDGEIATSTMDHAWLIWDVRHAGEPVVRWFDWKDFA